MSTFNTGGKKYVTSKVFRSPLGMKRIFSLRTLYY